MSTSTQKSLTASSSRSRSTNLEATAGELSPTPPLPLLENVTTDTEENGGLPIHADSNNVDNPLRTAETDCSN